MRRIIVLSSMSAFSGTEQLYGRAKLAIQELARSFGAASVRPGLGMGPMREAWRVRSRQLRVDRSCRWSPRILTSSLCMRTTSSRRSSLCCIQTKRRNFPSGWQIQFQCSLRISSEGAADQNGRHPRTIGVKFRDWCWRDYGQVRSWESICPFEADSLLGLANPASSVPNQDVCICSA